MARHLVRALVPWLRARQRFVGIAIANSDAGAFACTKVAIDQAFRAVQELTGSG